MRMPLRITFESNNMTLDDEWRVSEAKPDAGRKLNAVAGRYYIRPGIYGGPPIIGIVPCSQIKFEKWPIL